MNIITLNRVLLNNTPLNYRRKRILTEKDFYFNTIERTFTFSKSAGGKSIKDGRAYIKRIKGNSVVWNQQLEHESQDGFGCTVTWDGNVVKINGTAERTYVGFTQKGIPCVLNEKFLLIAEQVANPNNLSFSVGLFNAAQGRATLGGGKTFSAAIVNCISTIKSGFGIDNFGGAGTDLTGIQIKVRVINLTQMFQAGNEPTTFEEYEARKPIVADEYAYNEGQVIHCNTESIKSVGFNAWDEQWEKGDINLNTGEKYDSVHYIRTKNPIKVLPNQTYYVKTIKVSGRILFYDRDMAYIGKSDAFGTQLLITMPNDCHYIMYRWETTTYNNDICINLSHTGYRNGEYEPYTEDSKDLSIIGKYFPDGMKSAGSAHDEIRYNKASGKWEYSKGKIKSVDMGTLNWIYNAPNENIPHGYLNCDVNGRKNGKDNILNSRYIYAKANKFVDKSIYGLAADVSIIVIDSSYTDVATFKADMAGVMLYYEAAEWEWVELDAEDQNFRDYYQVADFGTEQSQSSVPSAALLADVGYYFKKSEVKELTLN